MLAACISMIIFSGCNHRGKYFVDSKYIISYASLSGTINKDDEEKREYMVDITYKTEIKLNTLKYKCELYKNDEIIETFEDEIEIQGIYKHYIPLKTKKEFDKAKVVCTGYSDENPSNFNRLNAMTKSEMKNCEHKNLIKAEIENVTTNNKQSFCIINYKSSTAYNNFYFYYDNYQMVFGNVEVCMDCGYFSTI